MMLPGQAKLRFPTLLFVASCLCVFLLPSHALFAENWPQWRGPEHNGVSRETGLPTTWSETEGVVWKCPVPSWGTSTPAIWGDAVFVTSHVDNKSLVLLKINKKTGRVEWTQEVGQGTAAKSSGQTDRGHQQWNPLHNMASPSPVTDGQLVIAHFGNGDLAAYDFNGKQLWRHNLQDDFGQFTVWWGHANSPVLYQDLVITVVMQDSLAEMAEFKDKPSPSYVVAHDKRTGQLRWKTPRPTAARAEDCDSYTTPVLWKHGDSTEMVVMGGQILDGYDPATGKRLWQLPGLSGSRVITGPVVAGDVAYLTQGMRKDLLAVKLGGQGELPKSSILWKYSGGTPDSPTPVVSGDLLFLVTNNGIARCLDLKTGQQQWEQRLKGDHSASPLAADGRIYFVSAKGLTTVVAASAKFEKLAENQLDDQVSASPIVSGGKIFIRGQKSLYCLGKKD
jgi:outer membrane protein assembly factor BamB